MKIINQLLKKQQSLNNLRIYLNIGFQETIMKIQTKSKLFIDMLDNTYLLKDLFTQIKQTYFLTSRFFEAKPLSNKLTFKKPTLYIYLAEYLKLSGVNYERVNDHLKAQYNVGDFLITAGDLANSFAKEHHINPILSFQSIRMEDAEQIKAIIFEYFISKKVDAIKFVFSSNKLINNEVTILPINQLAIKQEIKINHVVDFNQTLVFPDLKNFLENAEYVYLNNIVTSLIIEASLFPLNQKLVKLENSINELDKNIAQNNFAILKLKKEAQSNEIILQSNQDNQ